MAPTTPALTALQSIATHAHAFAEHPMSAASIEAAKHVVVDWVAVASGGASGVVASGLAAAAVGSPGPCRILGTGVTAPAPIVALVNGTSAHTLELDDIYAPGTFHPGAPTIAAALAAAELRAVSGSDFLRAVIVGYEVGNRIATDLGPSHYRTFHTTGTAGALAAAAAAGSILKLNEQQMAHALAISATLAAGLQQTFRSDAVAKPLHAGNAAHAGLIAAIAAQSGATGALDILDGEIGMARAMGAETPWESTVQPWDEPMLVEFTTMKPYPCCGHTFAAIDAAGLLRDQIADPDEISEIVVETYGVGIDTAGILRPVTPAEAKFSIPFTVATVLVDGGVDLDSFAEPRITDPAITGLVERVRLERSSEFTDVFPQRRGARVTMHLHDGAVHTMTVPDRFGSPENPMSDALLERKFRDLLMRSGSSADPDAVLQALMHLESIDDVREVPL